MRKEVPIDVVGSSSFDIYRKQSASETTNFYISNGALIPYPGYKKKILISATGQGREIFRSTIYDHLIACIGRNIYSISSAFGASVLGQIGSSSGDVFISENNASEIAITDGRSIWVFNYSDNSFEEVTVDFQPSFLTFQDGYLISTDRISNQWRLSELNNAKSWPNDSQHVGAIETKADLGVAAVRFNRQLFVFGEKVTEIWHDIGASLFPYQRNNSINIDYGCINKQTIAEGFGHLVWLGANEKSSAEIMLSVGGQPRIISTDGIDRRISDLSRPEISSGFLFQNDGHVFYQLTFPEDNYSLVYDITTNLFYTLTDEKFNYHIAKRIVFFQGKHYFISYRDGDIYEMDDSYFSYDYSTTEFDSEIDYVIPRQRITNTFRLPNNERFRVPKLTITMETGSSLNEQKIGHSISKDGGFTYSNIVMKTLPNRGNRRNMVRYYSLGMANELTHKFEFWGKSRFIILGATQETNI